MSFFDFSIELEIAEHNLQTLEMARRSVGNQRKRKEMGEPFCLSNSIKNTKSVPTDPKEYLIYKIEL